MIAVMLLVWRWDRRRVWGWLLLYFVADGLLVAGYNGLLFQYLLTDRPQWNNLIYWIALPMVTSAASRFFALLFGVSKTGNPWSWRTLRAIEAVAIGCGVVGVLGMRPSLAANLMERNASLLVLMCWWAALRQVRKGVPGGRWQLAAFSAVAVSALMMIARNQGVLPGGPLVDYIWQVNILVHGVPSARASRSGGCASSGTRYPGSSTS